MPFQFQRLEFPEIILVRPEIFDDNRGYFLETYQQSSFAKSGIPGRFIQDNYSYSKHGVLRGLHFQIPPQAQGKLVSVRQGTIFDVVVDIRVGSPTYGKWISQHLDAENYPMLFIPEGFAHGFQVISQSADVFYKVTAEYDPRLSLGIAWDDPDLDIPWPKTPPLLSEKDKNWPSLDEMRTHFTYRQER